MIIQVHMVPHDHPLAISFVIPPEVMNASQGFGWNPSVFKDPIRADIKIRKIEEDLFVQARIQGILAPTCDRCLTDYSHAIDQEVHFCCQPISQNHANLDEEGDIYYFDGANLDLTPMIREIVLLDLPMRNLCNESCQGLCGGCGANLNDGPHTEICEKSVIFPQKRNIL